MLNRNALKAEMVRYGYTNASMAKKLGISPRTFSTRLRKGFGSDEMDTMIELLHIENPTPIFFAQIVT